MAFNEDSRVKIPTILHLACLGYEYLSLKQCEWDEDTNIFINIFKESVAEINAAADPRDIDRLLEDVRLALENEDLGKAFHEMLTAKSGLKLIDFVNFSRNKFHVV